MFENARFSEVWAVNFWVYSTCAQNLEKKATANHKGHEGHTKGTKEGSLIQRSSLRRESSHIGVGREVLMWQLVAR
jgi:hypothetical protein